MTEPRDRCEFILKYHSQTSDESQHKNAQPSRLLAIASYCIQIPHTSLDIPPQKVLIRLRKRLALPINQTHPLFHTPHLPRPLRRHLPHKIPRPLLRLITRPGPPYNPQLQLPIKRLHQRLHETRQHRIAHRILITRIFYPLERPAPRAAAEEILAYLPI